jgi:hypothetical protein
VLQGAIVDGDRWLTAADRLYVVYFLTLVVACLSAAIRVFKAWRLSPRFSNTATSAQELKTIQDFLFSLQQWKGFIFLAWGIVVAVNLHQVLQDLREFLARDSLTYRTIAAHLFDLRYVTSSLIATLLTCAFLYLARWYLMKRLERSKRM